VVPPCPAAIPVLGKWLLPPFQNKCTFIIVVKITMPVRNYIYTLTKVQSLQFKKREKKFAAKEELV
jgi:hypothetical protein